MPDKIAKKDEDVKFAGNMNSSTGLFSAAAAGPNPKRYRSTNNAGNLNVVAKLTDSRPETLGKASRISGITPAAISLLLVYLKKHGLLRRSA